MTPWVVGSCVLLDVALKDPDFGVSSSVLLEAKRREGLSVCPVTIVEVAPFFDGEAENVRTFLRLMGAESGPAWMEADTEAAAAAWARYVRLKRAGSAGRRPVADILIGAFALRHRGLITRNPEHFRPFFPKLNLAVPGT
jgi:predicted nucleic acid-binding protein